MTPRSQRHVNVIPTLTQKDVGRFWAKVEKTQTCWLWKGKPTPDGYGMFHIGKFQSKTNLLAHRAAFLILHGRLPIPNGLHKCNTRLCVRVGPGHVYEGTMGNNGADLALTLAQRDRRAVRWAVVELKALKLEPETRRVLMKGMRLVIERHREMNG